MIKFFLIFLIVLSAKSSDLLHILSSNIYVRPITNISASELINNVKEFSDREGFILVNNDRNALIIIDYKPNFEKISAVINELDKSPPDINNIYVLTNDNPSLPNIINTILGGDTNYVFALSYNDFLVVKTDEVKIKEVREIINKLSIPVRELKIKIVKLNNIIPADFQNQISLLFTNIISAPDLRTSSIILLGEKKDIDKVDSLVLELERIEKEKKIHIVPFDNTNTYEIIRGILETIK